MMGRWGGGAGVRARQGLGMGTKVRLRGGAGVRRDEGGSRGETGRWGWSEGGEGGAEVRLRGGAGVRARQGLGMGVKVYKSNNSEASMNVKFSSVSFLSLSELG